VASRPWRGTSTHAACGLGFYLDAAQDVRPAARSADTPDKTPDGRPLGAWTSSRSTGAIRQRLRKAIYAGLRAALAHTGRPIVFSICQNWGSIDRELGPKIGAQMWRTAGISRGTGTAGLVGAVQVQARKTQRWRHTPIRGAGTRTTFCSLE